MKLSDIIERLDKSSNNKSEIYVDQDFATLVGLDVNYQFHEQDRLVKYTIGEWYCTDQHVGYYALFFDDVFVGIISKLARKSDETIDWVSKEHAISVREYVKSLFDKDSFDDFIKNMQFVDNEDDGYYKIAYRTQLLSCHANKAIYSGQDVEIIDRYWSYPNIYSSDNFVKIRTPKTDTSESEEFDVEMHELKFKYNII